MRKMKKHVRVASVLLALATGVLTSTLSGMAAISDTAPPHDKRPNIIVVMSDDLGYGSLGAYGHPFAKTPHLDRFAEGGLKFTAFYAPAPNCSPSRAGIMTGRHPYRVGIYNWIPEGNPMHLREWEVTIPELLKREGYDTYFVGKWHLNGKFDDPAQPQPGDHGFDQWMATDNNAVPSHVNPANFVRNGESLGGIDGLSAHIVIDQAVQWLESRPDPNQPFCLFVWFHEPHMPIDTTPRYKQLYRNRADEMERLYYGDVTHMDAAFGKLVTALERLDYRSESLILFTSDNGPEYRPKQTKPGSAGLLRGKKGHTYEGGIRVPAMIQWPGQVQPGTVTDEPVNGTDILPTICDIVGIPVPSDRYITGQSFTPVFRGQSIDRKNPMYWQMINAHHPHKIAIRAGDWKLLSTLNFSSMELYNLKEDIGEQHNLAGERLQLRDSLALKMKQLHDKIHYDGYDWLGLDSKGRPIGK